MPRIRHDAGQLALLNVEHPDLIDLGASVLLEIHGLVAAVLFDGGVVQPGHSLQALFIIGQTLSFFFHVGPVAHKGKGTVRIQQVRLECVDHFRDGLQPVFAECGVARIPWGGHPGVFRPVFLIVMIEIPPAQMLTDAKRHVMTVRSRFPQGQNVLMRAYVDAVHAVDFGVVVEEMVMMCALRHEIAGAGLIVSVHQRFRVEGLSLPQFAQILVAEFGRMAVMPQMVFILRRPLTSRNHSGTS